MAIGRARLESVRWTKRCGFAPAAFHLHRRKFAAFSSPGEVREALESTVKAKPEIYGDIKKIGIGYDRFRDLMHEVCPTVGDPENQSLFTSMDISGDGRVQTRELYSDIILKILHTRTTFGGDLQPVEGIFCSLPRPPFVDDRSQEAVVQQLAQIYSNVVADHEAKIWRYTPRPLSAASSRTMPQPIKGGITSMFTSGKRKKTAAEEAPLEYVAPDYTGHRGLYISGSSGSGKTTLLDVFYRSLPPNFPVIRLSYTEFCRDAFDWITSAESETSKRTKGRATSPFDIMANKLHKRCRVLLLDGLNITQPSEVLLVRDFFRAMWLRGMAVIVTANQPIYRLYRDGHNRDDLFEFFPEFRDRCPEVELLSDKDYRYEGLENSGVFLVGLNDENRALLDEAFKEASGEFEEAQDIVIPGNSRTIKASAASIEDKVVRFDFSELCGKAFGRSDYAHVATTYHTIVIDNIPEFQPEEIETFKRFEALVDMMYDKRVQLHTSSAVPLADVYPHIGDLPSDERLHAQRYQSIITEMSGTKYTSLAWLLRRHLTVQSSTTLR